MAEVNLGRVGFVPKGDYSTSSSYQKLDCVKYLTDMYGAKQDVPSGILPTNTTYWMKMTDVKSSVDEIAGACADLTDRVAALESLTDTKRYGVSGLGVSNPALTRIYDAVGMTAMVGTDGDNSGVVNDFDSAGPFMRRKCVGEWHLSGDSPVFHVNAYDGDPDYAEDGSMGDYVAVDCPPAYYLYDEENGALTVSSYRHEGYIPFDCLMDRRTGECRQHTYLPCYALAMKDGCAVSLPGYNNEQGDYASLFNKCRTANTDASSLAILMPVSVNFYEWAMFTVEFATLNCQSIMQGCCSLRHSSEDRIKMLGDGKWLYAGYASAAARENGTPTYYTSFVTGESISIMPTTVDINASNYYASHKIVSVTRTDADGNENSSGLYAVFVLEDLGSGREYEEGTEYRIAARPFQTGSCNGVSTPSGSPMSNKDGLHPMKYRWRENVYANQYQTVVNLMNYAVLNDGETNVGTAKACSLEWYYHPFPEKLTPVNYSNNAAGRDALIADGWEKLAENTPSSQYVNGFVKSRKRDKKYPDVWRPDVTEGASASTYFCDYAYLVSGFLLRSVRLGVYWYIGSDDGFSSALANFAPSSSHAFFGGSLYFPQ